MSPTAVGRALPTLRSKLARMINATDERFRAATRDDPKKIGSTDSADWWSRRVPRQLVGALRDDLESA